MKSFRALLLLIVLWPGVAAAQSAQRVPPQRRAALEAQIFNRFMNRVTTDMKLDAPGRARLEQHLRQIGPERRALAQRTVLLRRDLVQAVRNPATPDAEIDRLLAQFNQLRAQEEALWTRDQEALGQLLNPRQRAIFVLQYMQFNERIRELMQQRPGGRGSGS